MPIRDTLKARWFWYSLLCIFCWGGWALCSKLGSMEIPSMAMQFIFTLGTIPVALALLAGKGFRLEKSPLGIFYSVANGVLAGIGGLALFAAYRSGGSTSVITAATALYPMFTVVLAVLVLRERLTGLQVVGLIFAGAAIVIFSL
ncbi:MAG: DMT family transporter [Acidobacteriia bacterium]|nr:DMT family transporter [Terriglobia bacterium]